MLLNMLLFILQNPTGVFDTAQIQGIQSPDTHIPGASEQVRFVLSHLLMVLATQLPTSVSQPTCMSLFPFLAPS